MRVALIALLFLIPLASALDAGLQIDISGSDLVSESFALTLGPDESYETIRFISKLRPLSVTYEGNHTITSDGDGYVIDLEVHARQVNFTILYDHLVEKTSSGKVFRSSFSGLDADTLSIEMALPVGAYLESGANAIPSPDSMTSDGSRIILSWEMEGERDIAVFYKTQEQSYLSFYIVVAAVIAIVGFVMMHTKMKVREIVTDTLSDDEKRVVDLVRSGTIKQKEIAAKLDFSKSKMSKVMRKLEEKGLVEKTPHFKTNKIKLKKI